MSGGIPRWIEVPVALGLLILLSPLLLGIAVGVGLSSRGPVFFRQYRVGRHGVLFPMVKFRTMYTYLKGPEVTAGHDPRITPLGRILRRTKLDELPELWNIVQGDMSFVGPRPEVPRFVNASDPRWQQVLQVRPGLTDPVTLWLRNEEDLLQASKEDPEEFYRHVLLPVKLQRNLQYLAQRTAWTDLMLILRTLHALLLPGHYPPPSLQEVQREAERLATMSDQPGKTLVPYVRRPYRRTFGAPPG